MIERDGQGQEHSDLTHARYTRCPSIHCTRQFLPQQKPDRQNASGGGPRQPVTVHSTFVIWDVGYWPGREC